VILWQFRGLPEEREQAAMKGNALAATSLLVMPLLVVAKRRTARALGSATVMADSVQTLLCTYLSAVLLAGLAVDALFGLAWADPLAALIIGYVAVREGVEAWRGKTTAPDTRRLHARA
jgi:divalent metal cation (Fe/Co/Zn/Cd) transporter